MITSKRKEKLLESLKHYQKRFLSGSITELDESGTRIMINHFLTDVLGFTALEEVKTEYMIKGTYADYVIQMGGKRYFLIEVKAFSLNLNESHLRQAVNYGANEGIEYAMLTNGKQVDFYKILFEKPISHRKLFSIDLTNTSSNKSTIDLLEFLTKDAVIKNGLDILWNKCKALDPSCIANFLLQADVVAQVKKSVNKKFDTKFTDEQIQNTIFKVIGETVNLNTFKMPNLISKASKPKAKEITNPQVGVTKPVIENPPILN